VVCEILREAVKKSCDVELRITGRFLGEVREVGLDLLDIQLELLLDFRKPLGRNISESERRVQQSLTSLL
jgi:hypothetical protein